MKTSQEKIAYVDSGGPGFPIVFVHGNSCSSDFSSNEQKKIHFYKGDYQTFQSYIPKECNI